MTEKEYIRWTFTEYDEDNKLGLTIIDDDIADSRSAVIVAMVKNPKLEHICGCQLMSAEFAGQEKMDLSTLTSTSITNKLANAPLPVTIVFKRPGTYHCWTYRIDDEVEVLGDDGEWYKATVKGYKGDTYRVFIDDAEKLHKDACSGIRVLPGNRLRVRESHRRRRLQELTGHHLVSRFLREEARAAK